MIATAERIKTLRENFGLSQAELAGRLDITRSSVNAWEMGISTPSTQYLVELSLLFKVSTDFLLELNHAETVDISTLDLEEKTILYSMLNYFMRHRRIAELLRESGVSEPEELDATAPSQAEPTLPGSGSLL